MNSTITYIYICIITYTDFSPLILEMVGRGWQGVQNVGMNLVVLLHAFICYLYLDSKWQHCHVLVYHQPPHPPALYMDVSAIFHHVHIFGGEVCSTHRICLWSRHWENQLQSFWGRFFGQTWVKWFHWSFLYFTENYPAKQHHILYNTSCPYCTLNKCYIYVYIYVWNMSAI